jgi:hypothetical protein
MVLSKCLQPEAGSIIGSNGEMGAAYLWRSAKVTGGAAFGPDRHVGWFTQPWITVAVGLALMLGFLAFRSWLAS